MWDFNEDLLGDTTIWIYLGTDIGVRVFFYPINNSTFSWTSDSKFYHGPSLRKVEKAVAAEVPKTKKELEEDQRRYMEQIRGCTLIMG